METLALLILAAVAAWLLLSRRRRDDRHRRLAREGVSVDAEITKRFSARHPKNRQRRYYLAYRFETAPGHTFERQVNVTRAEYERAEAGGTTEVRYLPADPDTSQTTADLRARGFLV